MSHIDDHLQNEVRVQFQELKADHGQHTHQVVVW